MLMYAFCVIFRSGHCIYSLGSFLSKESSCKGVTILLVASRITEVKLGKGNKFVLSSVDVLTAKSRKVQNVTISVTFMKEHCCTKCLNMFTIQATRLQVSALFENILESPLT